MPEAAPEVVVSTVTPDDALPDALRSVTTPELVAVNIATELLLLTVHPDTAPEYVPTVEPAAESPDVLLAVNAKTAATSDAVAPALPAVKVLPPKVTVSPELNAEKVAVATSVVAAKDPVNGEVAPRVTALSVPVSVDCIVNT